VINIQETPQITKIYLVTNCYGDPNKVYIGKTINDKRKKDHIKNFGKDIIYSYIDEVYSLYSEDWKPLECFWIEYFRFLGFNIQNKNKGGGGVNFCKQETKDKIRQSNSGKVYGPKSDEIKLKISNKLKGRVFKKDHFDNLKKPVYRFNKIGEYIDSFESVSNASRDLNISLSDISSCCRGNIKSSGGFIWSYDKNSINIPIRKQKPVLQYDLEGIFIKQWLSINDITKFYNIKHNSNIAACYRGICESSHGYKWKYK